MATKKTAKAASPSVADDDFSFFKKIKVGDRYADKLIRHPNFGYCDSGSYIFNALLSGDLFGGFPLNKIIMVAGKQQSGKSFIAKNNFAYGLMQKGYYIYWYDTEGETTEEELEEQNGFNPDQLRRQKQKHITNEKDPTKLSKQKYAEQAVRDFEKCKRARIIWWMELLKRIK